MSYYVVVSVETLRKVLFLISSALLTTASVKSRVNVRTKVKNARLRLELWPLIELENVAIANALQLETARCHASPFPL